MSNVRTIVVTGCLIVACGFAEASEGNFTGPVTPAHVFARVSELDAELEALRYYMGKPRNEQPEIDVSNAEPREVYFQAQSLFFNADRLCWEHLKEHVDHPSSETSDIQPSDVLDCVNATMECVLRVKQHLGIEDLAIQVEFDPTRTPTDVFRAVVQSNRQLNILLDRQVAPSDVFEKVTQGVGYAARILEQFPDSTPIPKPPHYEIGKRPGDVYRRLVACFSHVKRLASASGLSVIDLHVTEEQIDSAEPSDVLHMASLVVSELAHLHAQLDVPTAPSAVFYVGRKFPSDVYQRAGLLELQLLELESCLNQASDSKSSEGAGR